MVHGALVALKSPAEGISRDGSGYRKAIINPGFDFRCLFIVIPGDELEGLQLSSGVVEAVHFRERLQPCLPTLLSHYTVRAP